MDEFIDTLERIAKGGSVVDPALVQELVAARRRDDPLAVLSAREREVLALMAEGRSNAGIARRLWVTEGTVEKHVRSILGKLTSRGRRRPPPGAGRDHVPGVPRGPPADRGKAACVVHGRVTAVAIRTAAPDSRWNAAIGAVARTRRAKVRITGRKR